MVQQQVHGTWHSQQPPLRFSPLVGSVHVQLDMVDFAGFSLMSYMCQEDAAATVRKWFPAHDFKRVYNTNDASASYFYDFYSSDLNLSIVAVRGTYSFW